MGWCVAGALAFEIARQLATDGHRISHLFLIDSWFRATSGAFPDSAGSWEMYSLRAQLIVADWRRVLASEKSIGAFISQRTLFKRLKRLFTGKGRRRGSPGPRHSGNAETYDQWLLAYSASA